MATHHLTHSPKADEVIAYTDGACSGNPGPAGLGVVMLFENARLELSEYLGQGTNNIAELTAIQRAAEAVTAAINGGEAPPNTRLAIYTDSTYAIGVLTKHWVAKANIELIHRVKTALAATPHCALIYVRGHAGNVLNEAADALAVAAVKKRQSPGWQRSKSPASRHKAI